VPKGRKINATHALAPRGARGTQWGEGDEKTEKRAEPRNLNPALHGGGKAGKKRLQGSLWCLSQQNDLQVVPWAGARGGPSGKSLKGLLRDGWVNYGGAIRGRGANSFAA